MSNAEEQNGPSRRRVLKQYVIGLGIGSVAALYGLVALAVGRTFLPGLQGNGHTVAGASGRALAGAYLLGGLYLLLRLFIEPRTARDRPNALLYGLENLVLVGFIAALIYVLMHVGAVE